MKIEEVEKELRDFSYGQLVNTKKYLELEYSKAETLKNALLEGLNNNKFVEDKELVEDTVNELYKVLQRIEDRAILVEKLKEEKEVMNLDTKITLKKVTQKDIVKSCRKCAKLREVPRENPDDYEGDKYECILGKSVNLYGDPKCTDKVEIDVKKH